MSWRVFGLFLYGLALLTLLLALALAPYAMLWGYHPLMPWPMQIFLLVVSGMLIWGGRTLRKT